MRDLTDDVALMRPVIEALRASGNDPEWVLRRVGLASGSLSGGRFPHCAQPRFWHAASEECGEEHIGLFLVGHAPTFHGLLLEYLFLSSVTFGAGLQHALRYVRLFSDTLSASLRVEGGHAELILELAPGTPRHFPEMLIGTLIRLFRTLTDDDFTPVQVCLMHERGAALQRYKDVYGCQTRLGTAAYVLVFDAQVLQRPSRCAAPNDGLARRQLVALERRDFVRQVRELIAELVAGGNATLEQVAGRLGMPPRRLRERLAVAGVRFNDLINDYRCALAKDLLLRTDERIEVIVERTGFSEPSTFYRAFKRWVGETPVEFRKRGRV